MDDALTMGTLCSGIGAPEAAAHALGWRSLFCSEIDDAARRILARRFGAGVGNGPLLFGDFTAVDLADFPDVDTLVAGTPCQSFSFAGKRASLEDVRGNLTLAAVRIVHELAARPVRPLKNFVWENVPGVLNTPDNAFGCFLAELVGADAPICPPDAEWGWTEEKRDNATGELIRAGAYEWQSCRFPDAGMVQGPRGRAAWRVLNSQYFGLAQRRERVFLVADFGNGADPAAVLFEPRGRAGDFVPSGGEELAQRVPDAEDCAGVGEGSLPGIAWALQERDAKGPDSSTKPGHLIPMAFKMRGREGGNTPEVMPGSIAPALSTDGGGSSLPFVAAPALARALSSRWNSSHRADSDTYIPVAFNARQHPIVTGNLAGPLDCGHPQAQAFALEEEWGWTVRRLTPTECERLQGFDDGHTEGESFTRRYSTLGNAMSRPVIGWLMRRVAEHMPQTEMAAPQRPTLAGEDKRGGHP